MTRSADTRFRLRSLWDLGVVRAAYNDVGLRRLVRDGYAWQRPVRGQPLKYDFVITAAGIELADLIWSK